MVITLQFSTAPYPGLRPFRYDESDVFFGRERQTDRILDMLGRNRFLAITGSSGCGKSSLVAAAVIPALQAGFMVDAGSRWRICTLRPGAKPLEELGRSLTGQGILGPEGIGEEDRRYVDVTLRRGPLGLIELVRGTEASQRAPLLVLVDQFEEIFRYHDRIAVDEADAFVALLLASVGQTEIPIYVVLTMRSDYLGQCATFHGLAEAVSRSQYLTPRLARPELALAIDGPARVFNGQVEPKLLNRLLNDFGTAQDQLPLLQHVLARLWDRCSRSGAAPLLTFSEYEAIGGLADALSRHGDEILSELAPEQQRVAEIMFRRLSGTDDERHDVRCPARIDEVARTAGVDPCEVIAVVEAFRGGDRSFLAVPEGPLRDDTMLDISHESLIRQWGKLKVWIAAESQAADMYRRVSDWASRWERGDAELWHGHDLASANAWRDQESPSGAWAERYGPPEQFQCVARFLDESEKAQKAADAAQEARRQLRYRRTRRIAWGLGSALAGVSIGILGYLVAFVWNYDRYYKDYVEVFGAPRGLGPLSLADLGHRTTSYKITQQGWFGPVVRMQLVNGVGQPRDRAGTVDAMFSPETETRNQVTRWDYTYDTRGRSVAYEMLFDRNGDRIQSTIYAPAGSPAVDGRYAYTTGREGSLTPEKGSCAAFSRVEYTPEGYEARVDYLDQAGGQTPGKDGAFSKLSEFDKRGYLIRRVSLWRDGSPMNDADGNAESRLAYDSAGNQVVSESFDAAGQPINGKLGYQRFVCEIGQRGNCDRGTVWGADGSPLVVGNVGNVMAGLCRSTGMHYDDHGNIRDVVCLMPGGQPAKYGRAIARDVYDEHDWPIEEAYLDQAERPALGPLGGVRQTLKHDQSGNVTELAFFGADGEPVDSFLGFHKQLNVFANGRQVHTEYRDRNDHLVAIRGGFAGMEKAFDRHGNETEVMYLGTDGKPAPNRQEGYAVSSTVRDGCGREISSAYLDENRRPVRSKRGYARITKVYNDQNQVAEESYFDEAGLPVRSIDGYAHLMRQFDRNRNVTSERYFDENGKAVMIKGGFAGRDAHYNDHNSLVDEAFLGTNAEPVLNDRGWARQVRRYDNHNGLIEEAFFGVKGEPVVNDEWYARAVHTNDVHGWLLETAYFDPDGRPVPTRHLYARKVDRRDADGKIVDESYFGVHGTPVLSDAGYARKTNSYDEFGRLTGWAYFGIRNEPVNGTTEPYHRASLILDERGNRLEVDMFGTDDKPFVSSIGHAKRVTRYDDRNRAVEEAYFGINGEPLADDDGYARITALKESHGGNLETAYFGIDGKPARTPQGYSRTIRHFNDYGDLIEEANFGLDGEPVLNQDGYFFRLQQTNDRLGRAIENTYFGTDNRPTDHRQLHAPRATFSYDWGEQPTRRTLFFANGLKENQQLKNGDPVESIVTDAAGALVEGPDGYSRCHFLEHRQCFDRSGAPLIEAIEIIDIKPESKAERAQLDKGDIFVSYDGVAVSDVDALTRIVKERASAAGEVTVVVLRTGQSVSVQVQPGLLGIDVRMRFVHATALTPSQQ